MRGRDGRVNATGRGRQATEARFLRESDESLAARAGADPDAFAELYRRYVHRIHTYCRYRLDDPALIEDTVSQIFLKALEGMRKTRVRHVEPWLFGIAYRQVMDVWRHRRLDVPLDAMANLAGGWEGLDEVAISSIDRTNLYRLLERLGDDQRRVVELRLAGLTGPEIRQVLGKSKAWVEVTQHRALKRLRTLFQDDLTSEGQ